MTMDLQIILPVLFPLVGVLVNSFFGRRLAAMVASLEDDDALARIFALDHLAEHFNAAQVGGEDHHALARVLTPQCAERHEQLLTTLITRLSTDSSVEKTSEIQQQKDEVPES